MRLNEIRDRAGRDQGQEAARPRHRLGAGQDLGQGREGPEGPLRRRHQGLRRRPDAAAPAPAEARLQQHLRQEVQRAQSRAASRRPSMRAGSTARSRSPVEALQDGGADPPRQGRRAPARARRDHRQARLRGHRRLFERDQGGRGERRHGHAEIASPAGRSPPPTRSRPTSARPSARPRPRRRAARRAKGEDAEAAPAEAQGRGAEGRQAKPEEGRGQRAEGQAGQEGQVRVTSRAASRRLTPLVKGRERLDGLRRRTARLQSQFRGLRQGRRAQEAHLVHARRAADLPARHLHPDPRHQPAGACRRVPAEPVRHSRHVQHVLGRRGRAHGDLRAQHHAVYLGVDHHPAAHHRLAASRAAEEGRRAGAPADQPIYPLRHGVPGRAARLRHRDRARRRGQCRARSRLVLPHHHRHHAGRRHRVPDVARRADHGARRRQRHLAHHLRRHRRAIAACPGRHARARPPGRAVDAADHRRCWSWRSW